MQKNWVPQVPILGPGITQLLNIFYIRIEIHHPER